MSRKITLTTIIHILIALGLIVYFKTLFNNFVWDDNVQIIKNRNVYEFNLIRIFTSSAGYSDQGIGMLAYYKPLMYVYFSIVKALTGLTPFLYHLVQISIHIINSIFVLLLLKKSLPRSLAFFLATIFLVHPINYEAVGYLAALQDTLFLNFGLLALLSLSSEKLLPKYKILRFSLVGVFLLLSLLSKETGIVFIPIGFLYLFLMKRSLMKYFLVALSAVIPFYLLLRSIASLSYYATLTPSSIMNLSFINRLINLPAVLFYYFKTLVYPSILLINQQWLIKKISIMNFYLPLFGLSLLSISLVGFGFYLYKKKGPDLQWYYLYASWLILGLFIHSHILVPLDMTVADRWFYFPIIGALGVVGICLKQLNPQLLKLNIAKYLLIFTALMIIMTLSTRTLMRSFDWSDQITLYTHDLRYLPENFQMTHDLGTALVIQGDYENAEKWLLKAHSIQPSNASTANNLGYVYEQKGDIEKADLIRRQALMLNKGSAPVELYRALTYTQLLKRGDYKESKRLAQEGLKRFPKDSGLGCSLALAENFLGNNDTAILIINDIYRKDKSQKIFNCKKSIEQNLPLK